MTNSFTRALSGKIMIAFGLLSIMLMLIAVVTQCLPSEGKFSTLLIGVMQNLFVFILVAILAAKLCYGKVLAPLKLNVAPSWTGIAMVLLIAVVSLPAMNWLVYWNEHITFPQSMQHIYLAFKQMEDAAMQETNRMLVGNDFPTMLLMVAVVGLITGLGEEIFFRGFLLGAFEHSKIHIHLSVWIVGLLFSVMHCQFFGLFPRWYLGIWLDYLMIWSRSLWLSVIAHALNNSLVVITYYLSENTDISTTFINEIGVPPAGEFPVLATISAALTIALIAATKKILSSEKSPNTII